MCWSFHLNYCFDFLKICFKPIPCHYMPDERHSTVLQMELLFVQLDISYSATIKEVPQILVVVKVSLFISVPLPSDE